MISKIFIAAVVMLLGAPPLDAQDPAQITFVSSHYRTASGAIGPSGVLAKQTYQIRIEGIDTIIVDRIVAGRRSISCSPALMQADDGNLQFSVSISLRYANRSTGKIAVGDQDISQCRIRELGRSDRDSSQRALVIFAHNDRTSFTLTRDSFDSERSQHNK